MEPIISNKINGKMAEAYAKADLHNHGFKVRKYSRCDFIAFNKAIKWFIEVKYNKARLSKNQKRFRSFCKRTGLNFMIYRVSPIQLEAWV